LFREAPELRHRFCRKRFQFKNPTPVILLLDALTDLTFVALPELPGSVERK